MIAMRRMPEDRPLGTMVLERLLPMRRELIAALDRRMDAGDMATLALVRQCIKAVREEQAETNKPA
jgi:hypothetical protein